MQNFRVFIIFMLSASLVFGPYTQLGFGQPIASLPVPGQMVSLSNSFNPAIIKGLTIDPEHPLKFDFIIDSGHLNWEQDSFKQESEKLIRYFMAALTTPEDNLWVNLSPLEKDRIIADDLAKTEMGQIMLAQDYLLKQITSSLIYPEHELGKRFWNKVYARAQQELGTTDIPRDTFHKVWIVPAEAQMYVHENTIFTVDTHLNVMMEEDYLALKEQRSASGDMSTKVMKDIILPELEKEVNTGKHFAPLRQMYHSLILAKWYKDNVKQALVNQIYTAQSKTAGIDLAEKEAKQQVYERYVKAYEKGVFNYIKEEYDAISQQPIPRKYFSGGNVFVDAPYNDQAIISVNDADTSGFYTRVRAAFDPAEAADDKAMTTVKGIIQQKYPGQNIEGAIQWQAGAGQGRIAIVAPTTEEQRHYIVPAIITMSDTEIETEEEINFPIPHPEEVQIPLIVSQDHEGIIFVSWRDHPSNLSFRYFFNTQTGNLVPHGQHDTFNAIQIIFGSDVTRSHLGLIDDIIFPGIDRYLTERYPMHALEFDETTIAASTKWAQTASRMSDRVRVIYITANNKATIITRPFLVKGGGKHGPIMPPRKIDIDLIGLNEIEVTSDTPLSLPDDFPLVGRREGSIPLANQGLTFHITPHEGHGEMVDVLVTRHNDDVVAAWWMDTGDLADYAMTATRTNITAGEALEKLTANFKRIIGYSTLVAGVSLFAYGAEIGPHETLPPEYDIVFTMKDGTWEKASEKQLAYLLKEAPEGAETLGLGISTDEVVENEEENKVRIPLLTHRDKLLKYGQLKTKIRIVLEEKIPYFSNWVEDFFIEQVEDGEDDLIDAFSIRFVTKNTFRQGVSKDYWAYARTLPKVVEQALRDVGSIFYLDPTKKTKLLPEGITNNTKNGLRIYVTSQPREIEKEKDIDLVVNRYELGPQWHRLKEVIKDMEYRETREYSNAHQQIGVINRLFAFKARMLGVKIPYRLRVEEGVLKIARTDKAMQVKISNAQSLPAAPTLATANSSAQQLGGIDFDPSQIKYEYQGNETITVTFNEEQVNEIIANGFDGFRPIIINITPLPTILPILGLAPQREQEYTELSVLDK